MCRHARSTREIERNWNKIEELQGLYVEKRQIQLSGQMGLVPATLEELRQELVEKGTIAGELTG